MPGAQISLLVCAPLAVAVGLIGVSRPAVRVARATVRVPSLLAVAAVVRLCLAREAFGMSPAVSTRTAVGIAACLLLWFCAANWHSRTIAFRVGLLFVAVGAAANAIPTVWAGAMPFSEPGARAAGLSVADITRPALRHIALARENGLVSALSDVLPIPWLRTVVSVGDVCLLVGASTVLAAVVPRRPRSIRATALRHSRRSRSHPCPRIDPRKEAPCES